MGWAFTVQPFYTLGQKQVSLLSANHQLLNSSGPCHWHSAYDCPNVAQREWATANTCNLRRPVLPAPAAVRPWPVCPATWASPGPVAACSATATTAAARCSKAPPAQPQPPPRLPLPPPLPHPRRLPLLPPPRLRLLLKVRLVED